MRLEGKVAIVTGGASGIGRATALTFGGEGARVAVVTKRNVEGGNAVVGEINDKGGEAVFIQADVTKSSEAAAMVWQTVEAFGKLDILVNSAGLHRAEPEGTVLDEDVFDILTATNLKGTYLCCKHAIPEMIKNGSGSIVNLGSNCGMVGEKGTGTAYSMTKGGVIAMTRALAAELGSYNIRANVICPTWVDTPMISEYLKDPELVAEFLKMIPLGKIIRPEHVAWAALYLASDEAAMTTGLIMPVDGGSTAI
jgi:NAD(P)-dependent dehydrogenase (short-subunit alcohol dehydrogenase family)